MQKFLHHSRDHLYHLLTRVNSVHETLIRSPYLFDDEFIGVLELLHKHFEDIGKADVVNDLLVIKRRFINADKGINPVTYLLSRTDRREFKTIAATQGLEKLNTILLTPLHVVERRLNEAEETLQSILLTLYQSELLTDLLISQLNTIDLVAHYWSNLVAENQQISLLEKKLLLQMVPEDIHLIIHLTLLNFKSNEFASTKR